jgi:hypothetical protein
MKLNRNDGYLRGSYRIATAPEPKPPSIRSATGAGLQRVMPLGSHPPPPLRNRARGVEIRSQSEETESATVRPG